MNKANPSAAEREAHLQNVEDTLNRIAHHNGVLGYFIMEPQKGKLLSFAGFRGSSREAHRYADTLKGFIDLTTSTVRTIDWKDEMTFLRISCDTVDILVAPDANKEYTMVVVQTVKGRCAGGDT
ncbi:dynein-associated protein [Leishmania donovani]|uniref:Dynein-associated_protein_putative/GeneDB:LmjF.31.3145 n=1 Tax=Leishmania donovani TaxID=5661 RepID=A0A504WZK3_LEIDO|nr:Roadblock/LC7 domain family protein [Leishmania donovani]CAJ1991526.1 dynein-associated protein [Leishmania donovani]VDZ47367.1 dynein-associated_protein_putative/GeneDB:LmjF.31.3145 [Leishmania donovani]